MANRKIKDSYKSAVKVIFCIIIVALIAIFGVPAVKKEMEQNGSNQEGEKVSQSANTNDYESVTHEGNNIADESISGDIILNSTGTEDTELTIWLDSWVWLPIAAANGGNETTPDSEFGKRGLTVHIVNNESDSEKAEAFKSGEIDAMAATVNRLAFLSGEFYGNTDYIVPYIMDYSSGGDGLVVRSKYNSIESLKDAKVGVGEGSVSQAMLIYLYKISNLSNEELSTALGNIVTYSSSEEAANAYLNGELDGVATWQPFLSECAEMTDSKLLFSTASSSTLISDAFIVNAKYAKDNPETVKLLIDGMLSVVEDLKDGNKKEEYYKVFRSTFPSFADSSDAELDTMFFNEAELMDWHQNIDSFKSGATVQIFKDMCNTWSLLGYETVPSVAEEVFDISYLESLTNKYERTPTKNEKTVTVNEEELENYDALISSNFTLSFKPYSAEFIDSDKEAAMNKISEFAAIAKVLDGCVIRIEGNVSSHADSPELRQLSLNRAEKIKEIMVETYKIDADIIFCYGNGASKQKIADPVTEEEYALNRSVDVFFVTSEEVFE